MKDLEKLGQKITFTLLAGQSLFSAAMIMAFTIMSITAVQLANDNTRWAGVPSTLVVIGAAMIAYPIGRLMDKVGRRIGLSIGYVLGITSSLVAGFGVINESLPIFLAAVFGLGLTRGVLSQGRYAAAEASPPRQRARAISLVVLGGTVGSVFGPVLIDSAGNLADRAGLPTLSGPWFVAVCLFGLALLLINLFLRPDPTTIGRRLAALEPQPDRQQDAAARSYREIFRDPRTKIATGSLIFGQLAMGMVMTMTPVHMDHHHHNLAAISWVFMAHTLGMFGFSFLSGWLADKLGRTTIILIGGLILALSGFLAPLSNSVPWLIVSLFLLGLGWNFCFVAGSALLSDVLKSQERGRVQGLTETMTNAVSGVGSTGSGLIFAAFSYLTLSWLTILIGLVPVILVILLRASQQKVSLATEQT